MEQITVPIEDGRLHYIQDFIAEPSAVFSVLHTELAWSQGKIKLFGKSIPEPRLSAFYADADVSYTYSGKPMEGLVWHPLLMEVKQHIERQCATTFNSVLCNLYRNGQDSMGWHADDEASLGLNPTIASVSLGAVRKFQLKHRSKPLRKELLLASGSLLLMQGCLQHYWLHRIVKTTLHTSPRINLTFRAIKGDAAKHIDFRG